jgi:hypothetical protein
LNWRIITLPLVKRQAFNLPLETYQFVCVEFSELSLFGKKFHKNLTIGVHILCLFDWLNDIIKAMTMKGTF